MREALEGERAAAAVSLADLQEEVRRLRAVVEAAESAAAREGPGFPATPGAARDGHLAGRGAAVAAAEAVAEASPAASKAELVRRLGEAQAVVEALAAERDREAAGAAEARRALQERGMQLQVAQAALDEARAEAEAAREQVGGVSGWVGWRGWRRRLKSWMGPWLCFWVGCRSWPGSP